MGCWRRNGGRKWAYEEWEMGRARMVVCLTSVACNAAYNETLPFPTNMHPLKNQVVCSM